ncbi:MAG: ABC transporter permease [Syntrophothermus sp.]
MKTKKLNSPLIKIMLRETFRIAERKTLYSLIIVLPVLLFFIFALIYKSSVVRDLPVVIYDADNSELSRMLTRSADAASSMAVYKYVNSISDVKQEFLRGNAQGAFYFPKGLEADLKSGKKASVVLFKNTTNLIVGNLLYKDGVTVIRTISGGILLKKLKSRGLTEEKAMTIVNPIRLETHALFNPYYNYSNYIIPGLIMAVLQMIIMISGVLVISSEFSHNTFAELVQISGGSALRILCGKAVPHLLIHSATLFFVIGLIFPVFNIEIRGSVIFTMLFSLLFICAALFPALLISSFFHEQLLATEMAVFINTPSFIFSGFTFPLWSMPALHNYFSIIIPYTHFITGFLKIYQMQAPARYVIPEITALIIFAAVSFAGSAAVLKREIKTHAANIKAAEEGVLA